MSEVCWWAYVGSVEVAGLVGEWKGREANSTEWRENLLNPQRLNVKLEIAYWKVIHFVKIVELRKL